MWNIKLHPLILIVWNIENKQTKTNRTAQKFPIFLYYDIKIDILTTVDFIRFIWWYPFKAWQHLILSEIFYDPNLTQQTWHTVTCLLSYGLMFFKVVVEFIYVGIASISQDVFWFFKCLIWFSEFLQFETIRVRV